MEFCTSKLLFSPKGNENMLDEFRKNYSNMNKYLCSSCSLMKEDKNVTDCVGLHS